MAARLVLLTNTNLGRFQEVHPCADNMANAEISEGRVGQSERRAGFTEEK